MSRSRRVICVFVGLFMLVMGALLGFTSQVMSGQLAISVADRFSDQLLDDLESSGASFEDRDEARSVIFGAAWNEFSGRSDAGAFYFLALIGLFPIVFALIPSRKVGGPVEPSPAHPESKI